MIDAYDVLGCDLDADEDAIKKAFKKMSIRFHPDKVQGNGGDSAEASEKFVEIKAASEILLDADRRKIYDTFGVDIAQTEKPEIEVWTIGLSNLLSPLGVFALKTLLMRTVIWIVAFRWIGYLLMSLGPVGVVLYCIDFKYREFQMRSQEGTQVLWLALIIFGVVLVCWIWELFAEGVGVFYLAAEVLDVAIFIENIKIGVGAAVVSLFAAWLVKGWWTWIIGLQVLLALVMLVALMVASGLMGLWIENVKQQHGDKLKEWRLRMRKERDALQAEVKALKQKVQDFEQGNGKR